VSRFDKHWLIWRNTFRLCFQPFRVCVLYLWLTQLERLLNALSMVLSGQAYRQPGAPDRMSIAQLTNTIREIQSAEQKDVDTFTVALNTLGSFDFTGTPVLLSIFIPFLGHSLHEFLRECVVAYLEDDVAEIRRAATLTCCHVLVKDSIVAQHNTAAMLIVGDILEKLLAVGIADPGAFCSLRLTSRWFDSAYCINVVGRALRSSFGAGRKCPIAFHCVK
jgi:hypothetical protein